MDIDTLLNFATITKSNKTKTKSDKTKSNKNKLDNDNSLSKICERSKSFDTNDDLKQMGQTNQTNQTNKTDTFDIVSDIKKNIFENDSVSSDISHMKKIIVGNKNNKTDYDNVLCVNGNTKFNGKNIIDGEIELHGNNNIIGDCFIDGNLYLNNNFMTSNAFFNNNIFINNSLNLASEKITFNAYGNTNTISDKFYSYIFNNMLDTIKNIDLTNSKFSSIKFYSEKNKHIIPAIVNVNKKFTILDDIFLGSGLFYIMVIKKKIIAVKPLMDTFIILNKKYNIVSIKQTIEQTKKIEQTEHNNLNNSVNPVNPVNPINSNDSYGSNSSNGSNSSDGSNNLVNMKDMTKSIQNELQTFNKSSKTANKETINLNEYLLNILTSSIDEKSINSMLEKLSSNDNKKK